MTRPALLAIAVAAAAAYTAAAQKPAVVDLQRCADRPNEPLLLLSADERVELRFRTVGPLYASSQGLFFSTLQALPWAWADVVISTHWRADGSKRAGAEVTDGVAATVGSVADLASSEQQSYLWSWVSFLSDPLDMRGAAMKAIERVRGSGAQTWEALADADAANSTAGSSNAGARSKGSGGGSSGSRLPPKGVLSVSPFTPLSRWGAPASSADGGSSSSSSSSSVGIDGGITPVSLAYPRARLVAAAAASRSVHARAAAAALPEQLEVRCRVNWVAPRYPLALAAGVSLFANAHALAAHPATYYGGGFAAGVTLLAGIALVMLYRQRNNRVALVGAAALGATAATMTGFLQALGGVEGLAGLDASAAAAAAAACDPAVGPCLPQLAGTASSLARAWSALPYAALAALLLCGILTVAALHCCKPAHEVPSNVKEVLGYALQAVALASLLFSSASLELSVAAACAVLLGRSISALLLALLRSMLRCARLFGCCDSAIARGELAWDNTCGRLPCCCRCNPARPAFELPPTAAPTAPPAVPHSADQSPGGAGTGVAEAGLGQGQGQGHGHGQGNKLMTPQPARLQLQVQGQGSQLVLLDQGDGTFLSPLATRADGSVICDRVRLVPAPLDPRSGNALVVLPPGSMPRLAASSVGAGIGAAAAASMPRLSAAFAAAEAAGDPVADPDRYEDASDHGRAGAGAGAGASAARSGARGAAMAAPAPAPTAGRGHDDASAASATSASASAQRGRQPGAGARAGALFASPAGANQRDQLDAAGLGVDAGFGMPDSAAGAGPRRRRASNAPKPRAHD